MNRPPDHEVTCYSAGHNGAYSFVNWFPPNVDWKAVAARTPGLVKITENGRTLWAKPAGDGGMSGV
jgi:hypothetical protein